MIVTYSFAGNFRGRSLPVAEITGADDARGEANAWATASKWLAARAAAAGYIEGGDGRVTMGVTRRGPRPETRYFLVWIESRRVHVHAETAATIGAGS